MFGLFQGPKCERCEEPKSYGRVCDPCLKSGYRIYRPLVRGSYDFDPKAQYHEYQYGSGRDGWPAFDPYDIQRNWPQNRCFICNKIHVTKSEIKTLHNLCAFHIPDHPDDVHEDDSMWKWDHLTDPVENEFSNQPRARGCRNCGGVIMYGKSSGLTQKEYLGWRKDLKSLGGDDIFKYYKIGSKNCFSKAFDCIKDPNLEDKQKTCSHDYMEINKNKAIYESKEEALRSIKEILNDDLLADHLAHIPKGNKCMMEAEASRSSKDLYDNWCWKCGRFEKK